MSSPNSTARTTTTVFAWHGWRVALPSKWNPVKIEGDFQRGEVLFADMQSPRLGFRWNKAGGRRFNAAHWTSAAMKRELGKLAADEAKDLVVPGFSGSTLFVDREPPGRDVWVGYSETSSRGLELVYRSRRREHVLAELIVPTAADTDPDEPSAWSIFGLSCIVPAGMLLTLHRLNAGDLTLRFEGRKHQLIVRTISLADEALKRMSIDRWLARFGAEHRKHYRRMPARDVESKITGRMLKGVSNILRRRPRFFWAYQIPREQIGYLLHDSDRNRLVYLQATTPEIIESVAAAMDWADKVST